jgi:hypothetical protein
MSLKMALTRVVPNSQASSVDILKELINGADPGLLACSEKPRYSKQLSL